MSMTLCKAALSMVNMIVHINLTVDTPLFLKDYIFGYEKEKKTRPNFKDIMNL